MGIVRLFIHCLLIIVLFLLFLSDMPMVFNIIFCVLLALILNYIGSKFSESSDSFGGWGGSDFDGFGDSDGGDGGGD